MGRFQSFQTIPRSIILLDPSAATQQSLSAFFKLEGYDTCQRVDTDGIDRQLRRAASTVVVVNWRICQSDLSLAPSLVKEGVPFVVLLETSDIRSAVGAFRAGAVDLIIKPYDSEELLSAVAKGMRAVQRHASGSYDKLNLLSERERQILDHVLEGMTSKEIARRLSISHRTVDCHRTNILAKYGARNFANLTTLASRNI